MGTTNAASFFSFKLTKLITVMDRDAMNFDGDTFAGDSE